jgi:hypothetical protein
VKPSKILEPSVCGAIPRPETRNMGIYQGRIFRCKIESFEIKLI